MVPFQGAICETPGLYTLLFLNLTSVVSQPGKSDVYCKCPEDSEIWDVFKKGAEDHGSDMWFS